MTVCFDKQEAKR